MFKISDVAKNIEFTVPKGILLLDALIEKGILNADSPCGGKGICRKCLVKIYSEDSENSFAEVLACQTYVNSNLKIESKKDEKVEFICLTEETGAKFTFAPNIKKVFIESLSNGLSLCWEEFCLKAGIDRQCALNQDINIIRQLANFAAEKAAFTAIINNDKVIALEVGDTRPQFYGMAFDIGTTTIAGYLWDLSTGNLMQTISALNPQIRYGSDVVTRITLAAQEKEGLEKLHSCLIECINELIESAATTAQINRENIYDLVFVGNPSIEHFFLKILPDGLGKSPYNPVFRQGLSFKASQIELKVNELAEFYWLPLVAGFVGADTIGVLLAHPLDDSDMTTLMVDIGTNGEMALSHRGNIWACSTAAGPCFEGSCLSCGMRAQTGAIDKVWIQDKKLLYSVIGNGKARGICGSGVFDAVAAMLQENLIDSSGRLSCPDNHKELKERFAKIDGNAAFVIVPAEYTADLKDIVITQKDIREIQLAKAAIAAGVAVLMKKAGISETDVDRVILAGAFGLYLNPKSMSILGILPEIICPKIQTVGNAAGAGSQKALLCAEARKIADNIAEKIKYVELTGAADFSDIYLDKIYFPEQS